MPVPDSIIEGTFTGVIIRGRYVGPYTFYLNTSLTNVTGNLRIVDEYSFYGCTHLTNSSLRFDYLDYIGYHAFENCYGLSGTLDLGGVTYIGSGAFAGCTNITGIKLSSFNCILADKSAFPSSVTTIAVPADYVDVYKSNFGWKNIADKIVSA